MKTLAADSLASGSSSQHSWIVSTSVLSPWGEGRSYYTQEGEGHVVMLAIYTVVSLGRRELLYPSFSEKREGS